MAAEGVKGRRVLVKGGHVLTMDESLGDLEVGDVLIEDGRIAAVGHDLGASADEVIDASGKLVLPGLIDSHIHLWQTPLRGAAGETWADEYFKVVHPVSGRFSPEDMRVATYAGGLELLSHGRHHGCRLLPFRSTPRRSPTRRSTGSSRRGSGPYSVTASEIGPR